MARTHARVSARLWTGQTGRDLRAESPYVRLVEHWLMFNETAIAEPYGLYLCQPDVAAIQIGSRITEPMFLKSLGDLARLGFVRWDDKSRFVWVIKGAGHQLLENWTPLKAGDWRIVAARRWYAACPDNPFLGPFFDLYAKYLGLEQRRESVRSQGAFEAPISTSGFDLVGEEGGVGGETPRPSIKAESDFRIIDRANELLEAGFAEWWEIYPVKVGKGATKRLYFELKPPQDRLMATTRAYIESEEWAPKSDGKAAIPHPRTFLYQGRWEDTPTPLRSRARGPRQGDDWREACPHQPKCQTPRLCEARQMKAAAS